MGAPFGATGSEAFADVAGGDGAAAGVAAAEPFVVESCFAAFGGRVRRRRPATAPDALGSADGVIVAVTLDAACVGAGVGSAATVGGGATGAEFVVVASDAGVGSLTFAFEARSNMTAATATTAIETTTPAARPFANERGRSTGRMRSDP